MKIKIFLFLLLLTIFSQAQTSDLAVSDSLYALGNYAEALSVLKKIPERSPAVLVKLARTSEASGNWKNALNYYQDVIKKNPDKLLTAVDYGELLLKSGELVKADSLFQNLATKYPKNAQFQYKLGIIKEQQNDSVAIKNFEKAVQLDTTHQPALYKMAKFELEHRNYIEAEKYAISGLDINAKNTSLLSILAQTYYNQEAYHKALENFKTIAELGQGNEFVFSKMGMCYYYTFQYEKAIDSFKECLKYEDRNSDTHYNLGKLYAQKGELDKSEAEFLMALLIKKQPVDAEYLSLALTYKLKEDYEKMLRYTKQAILENPENERAWYEKAIAGDNYFKDLSSKTQFYEDYLNKFSKNGNERIIELAKNRLTDLREKEHLKDKQAQD